MQKCPENDATAGNDRLESLLPDVTRIGDDGRALHPRRKIAPVARQRLRDEQQALTESLSDRATWEVGKETGEELVFLRDGLQLQTLRKLRRGHWVIQKELDLHGHTTDEARAALVAFMQACLRNGARCIRIVHGKGLRSKNREPVLKNKVGFWLQQRDEVLAFCQARQVDGGSGAVTVLLKSKPRR